MPNLICGKTAVGRNYNSTRDNGGNEGIYLDLWIEYIADGKGCANDLGTFKTLSTDDEAMHIMANLLADFIIEEYAYGNTDMVCKRYGSPVYQSDHAEYSYQCFRCDEDLYSFEVTEQDGLYLPRVIVARSVNGITLTSKESC